MRFPRRRRGTTPAEVLVVLVLVVVAALMLLLAVPRQREHARAAACRGNLARIGIALALYDQAQGHLPAVAAAGPLETLRTGLGLDDFDTLHDPKTRPRPVGPPPAAHRLAGFLCPSDRVAIRSAFPAPTSYRACAGGDSAGLTGAFPLDGRRSLAEIDAADGLAYTAAFSERLIGANTGNTPPDPLRRYAVVPGPVGSLPCPPQTDPAALRDNAGGDWSQPGWTSSLYNHAIPPNDPFSCVAADGRTARIGAASAHPGAVHLLRLDLSVTAVSPRIDPDVWRRMATVREAPPPAP